ncbi:hypothetical protein [Psychrobium sp. 1_MG-2023]|uniref:hypothetical protein n=1 Tax=Psychrobium sp. 1_MG-2023 TaxID=3062624 RepID=UPI000C31EA99|nr:hypothetical protein [Psychrobium sp. 1_MG-2023]MDP2560219.1 hypothetical protein [Psychrobium sp. 1_MG-2023]PKF57030.1 hypothetical protein CW748_08000 [Alteromonadales bacterium alter-6D02]
MTNLLPVKAITLLATLLLTFTLTGCGGADSKKLPEDVAEEFINAVYNTKDISVIKQHSSDKVLDLIEHYRTVKMIQRHLMDLTLDSAKIQVTDVGGDFFRKSKKDNKVEIHIRGDFQGNKKADDRFILMTWQDGRWKVKKVTKS